MASGKIKIGCPRLRFKDARKRDMEAYEGPKMQLIKPTGGETLSWHGLARTK